jgi:hypothetical protein
MEARGSALAEAGGFALAEARGSTLAEARGSTLAEARGSTLAEARGSALACPPDLPPSCGMRSLLLERSNGPRAHSGRPRRRCQFRSLPAVTA